MNDTNEVTAASDDRDLALSRLKWVEACTCQRTHEQAAALQWHAAELAAAEQRLLEVRRINHVA